MNPAKCDEYDYINFLIASVGVFTCTEAAKCQTQNVNNPSHDAFTRLLQRQPPDTEGLWTEVKPCIRPKEGFLVLDDTTLDKPYSRYIELAKERRFKPSYVLFDSWYSGIDNLKAIRKFGWHWLTRFKKNRLVNPDNTGNVPIETIAIPIEGIIVHLKAYGFIKVFKIVADNGDIEYWATDILNMDEMGPEQLSKHSWKIEEYHRGLKQFCGIERCQARKSQSQRAHIMFSIRAFLRLELIRLRKGISWFESKRKIIRSAICAYAESINYLWPTGATAQVLI